jgi:alcohol dehydrogenase, propanol-preferring
LHVQTAISHRSQIPTIVKDLTNGYGAHAAICLASSRAGYVQSLSLLRNLGTLVCIGLGADDIPISPFMTIVRGLKIVGSSVGSEKEMNELLEMAARGDVKPIVKVFEFERLDEVLGLLARGEVSGRVVVRIPE